MQHHLPRSVFLLACTATLALAPVGADEIRFERIPDGYANGVSDDGAVVVGERFGLEAFTWTLAGGLVDIGGVSGISAGADGRRIAGNTSSIFGDSAARYDATTGTWSSFAVCMPPALAPPPRAPRRERRHCHTTHAKATAKLHRMSSPFCHESRPSS